jgi:hypothetical protein
MTPPFTPGRIALILLFYAALFVVISISGRTLTKDERKTFLLLCGAGFSIAFITNFLLFKIGAMTFLPWINNFLHSFFWIGLGFPWLYFATRGRSPLVVFITVHHAQPGREVHRAAPVRDLGRPQLPPHHPRESRVHPRLVAGGRRSPLRHVHRTEAAQPVRSRTRG